MLVNTAFKLFLIIKQLEDRLQGNKSLETLGLQKIEEKPSFEQQRLKGASLLKLDDYNPGPDKLKYLNENKINQAQNRANMQKPGQTGSSSTNKRASPYAEGPDIPAEEIGLKDPKILDAIRAAEDDSMRDLASDHATYEYRQKMDQSRALITTAPLITDTMNRNKVGDTDPQLLTEFYDNERKIYFNEARKFLSSYVASVEILFNGTIEKVHFQIPYCCKFISDNIKRSIIWDVNRSSDQERVESFYFKVRYYELEMKRRQSLSAWKFLYFLTKNWRIVKYLNYALILVLNIFMMVYFKHEFLSSSNASEDFTPTRTVDIMRQSVEALLPAAAERFTFRVVSYAQVVLSFLVLVFCAFERLPKHLYKPSKNDYYIREKEKLKNQKFDDGLHSRIQRNEDERNDSISTQNSFFEMLLTTCLDFTNVYNIVLFGISILGVFGYYLLYSLLLFDVLKLSRTMTRITLALYKNLKLFGLTLLLALFILYFYSVIGFNYFPKDYLHGSDMVYKNYCHTLLDCFISTANNGLRARGGIGEALGSQYREAGDFWQRVAFDITFFLVIMVLLLNVIFGVIIDSFSAMREELNRLSEDVENKCYICGLQKFELDTKGEGWYRHIFESHNVYNYLYFLIYIEKKDMGDCSGVEKYVKELCMRNSASFFPIGRSLSIEKPRKLA